MAEVVNRSLHRRGEERARRTPGRLVGRASCSRGRCTPTPLRKHDCAPVTDGAAAIVLAAGDRARDVARTTGLDHRHLDARRADSHRAARPDPLAVDRQRRRRRSTSAGVEVAELHAPFSHQELDPAPRARPGRRRGDQPVGRRAARPTRCSPAGLIRIGEAAAADPVRRGTTGAGARDVRARLQQNLVCVAGGRPHEQAAGAVIGIGQTHHRAKREDVSMAGLVPRGDRPGAGRRRT